MEKPLFVRALLLVAFMATVFDLAACQHRSRTPNRYLIPNGYVGWVRINYDIAQAPPILFENGRNLLVFPPTGQIDTSSIGEEGAAEDQYFYYNNGLRQPIASSGDGKLIWGEIAFGSLSVPNKKRTKYQEFFVGTKEQYEKIGVRCKDADLNPIIGAIEKCPQD